jgi:hypothetical protein
VRADKDVAARKVCEALLALIQDEAATNAISQAVPAPAARQWALVLARLDAWDLARLPDDEFDELPRAKIETLNAGAVIFASWSGPEAGIVGISSVLAGTERQFVAAIIEHFGLEQVRTEQIGPAEYVTWFRGTRNFAERLNYAAYKEVL